MTVTDIEVKTVAPQRVVGLHKRYPKDGEEPDVEALFELVITFMDAAGPIVLPRSPGAPTMSRQSTSMPDSLPQPQWYPGSMSSSSP